MRFEPGQAIKYWNNHDNRWRYAIVESLNCARGNTFVRGQFADSLEEARHLYYNAGINCDYAYIIEDMCQPSHTPAELLIEEVECNEV